MELDGKGALVTGAGSGVGRATSLGLGGRGAGLRVRAGQAGEMRRPDGGRIYPYGPDATGFIFCTEEGCVSATLMARPPA